MRALEEPVKGFFCTITGATTWADVNRAYVEKSYGKRACPSHLDI